jgi:flagellar hook-associated protein 3 FlgL
MLSSLNAAAQQFLTNLTEINQRTAQAELQISSGLKITQVSDAPDSIALLLEADANLSATNQTLTNLGQVKTEVDAGEQALETAAGIFDNVQTLGAEGNTDTQTAAGRTTIAQQLNSLLQEMVGLAGTNVGGRYIFAGNADQQIPYIYTAGAANPVSAYLGSASTRVAQYPNGTTFPVALTAQQIFDSASPATNVFSAIENLSTALQNNNSAAIATAVDGLAGVGSYLNSQLAFYGNTQDKVADATNFGNTLQVQLQTQISNLQDANLTESILNLTQDQTQEQAALQSEASLPRKTLFDYLA